MRHAPAPRTTLLWNLCAGRGIEGRRRRTIEMVLDGDGNRWNAHVDPASGNTYYVNERTGVSSWTLPKKGTSANGAAAGGASPLKIVFGVAILAVLACFLPADSALRGAVPFSFPVLSRGRVLLHNAVETRLRPSRAGAWPRCGRCASSTSSPRCPVRLRCPFALCSSSRRLSRHSVRGERTPPDAIDADPRDRRRAVGRAAPRGRVDAAPARRRDGRRRLCVEDEARRRRRRRPGVFPASPFPVFVIRGVPRSRG